MSASQGRRTTVPPRFVFRALWALHRAGYAITGGRLGLRTGGDQRVGTLRLRTTGRRSGRERAVMLNYLPVGEAYAVVASNAGASEPPAWWRNLQARPRAMVDLPSRSLPVRAREADGHERELLWRRFVEQTAAYEQYAATAERVIPIVILEPTDEEADA